MALGASLAAGCRGDFTDGLVVAGSDLDSSITPSECFDNITGAEVSLENQTGSVGNPSKRDASVSSDGQFHDEYEFFREELLNNAVLLAAIGNINGSSNTIREGEMYTESTSEDFGNDDITTESPIVDAYVDFGDVPSLDGTKINTVITDSTCSQLYSPVYDYTVEDYGYDDYYVEEQN